MNTIEKTYDRTQEPSSSPWRIPDWYLARG
jgi:hypothetical protein